MRVELSYSRFFEPKQYAPEVENLLYYCIANKLSLRLKLGLTGVSLSVSRAEDTHVVLSLTGRWRSPLLEGTYRSSGTLLLIPFLFLIEDFSLTPSSFYTLGHGHRSVADFFMRNFFFAACRKEEMAFQMVTDRSNAAVTEGSRGLVRTYLWIAKDYLNDEIFDRSNAPELLLASAHLSLLEFSNPLLKAGAADFRRVSAQAVHNGQQAEQKRAFLQARKRMLATYPQARSSDRSLEQKKTFLQARKRMLAAYRA